MWIFITSGYVLSSFVVRNLMTVNLRRTRFVSITNMLFFTLFGITYYATNNISHEEIKHNKYGEYTGIVTEFSAQKRDVRKFTVHIDEFRYKETSLHINEMVLMHCYDSVANQTVKIGNRITFKAALNPITGSGNPSQFDYGKYMQAKGVYYQCYVKTGISSTTGKGLSMRTKALVLREKIMERFRKTGLSDNQLGILAALTIGERQLLTPELKSSFSASGATHILAVSGLHVGIVSILIGNLLGLFIRGKRGRKLKSLIVILLLWCYAFISGLSPSIMRAATMFSFVEFGHILGRKGHFFNTLAASAFLLLLINPFVLFEIGFQLSYFAVSSIVYFQPLIAKLFSPKTVAGKWIWSMLTVSVAAQIGTTPLCMYYFHQFPTYFWLSNFIAIPAAAAIMYLAVTYLLLSFIPIAATVIVFVLRNVISALIFSMQTICSIPGAVIDNIWITPETVFLLYVLVLSVSAVITKKSVLQLKVVLVTASLLVALSCFSFFKASRQTVLIVYNMQNPTISLIVGRNHYFYVQQDVMQNDYEMRTLRDVSGMYNTKSPIRYIEGEFNMMKVCENYLIINGIVVKFQNVGQNSKPEKDVDFIIDSRNRKVLIADGIINKCNKRDDKIEKFDCEKQVADLSVILPEKVIEENKVSYIHSLRDEGAIIVNLIDD